MRANEAGFGLIELMVALLLFAAVMVAILETLVVSAATQGSVDAVARIDCDARLAVDRMVRELRMAEGASMLITTENGSDRIDFRIPGGIDPATRSVVWSSVITYRREPSRVDANGNGLADDGMLTRTQDGNQTVVCHRLELLDFSQGTDSLSIRIELVGGADATDGPTTAETAINLRN